MKPSSPKSLEARPHAPGRLALIALAQSAAVNLLAPALVYRLAERLIPGHGLLALALSGVPPVAWLAFSAARLRALDLLGLFSAQSVIVSLAALILSHTERQALMGRSLQNVVLALIFLGSLALGKPLVLAMARQLATGNDPAQKAHFDVLAARPEAAALYLTLTWVWTFALLIKAGGTYALACSLAARDFLPASASWDLLSDSVLVGWTLVYARARLTVQAEARAPHAQTPDAIRAGP